MRSRRPQQLPRMILISSGGMSYRYSADAARALVAEYVDGTTAAGLAGGTASPRAACFSWSDKLDDRCDSPGSASVRRLNRLPSLKRGFAEGHCGTWIEAQARSGTVSAAPDWLDATVNCRRIGG